MDTVDIKRLEEGKKLLKQIEEMEITVRLAKGNIHLTGDIIIGNGTEERREKLTVALLSDLCIFIHKRYVNELASLRHKFTEL